MSTSIAAGAATLLSLGSLIAVLITVPMIHQRVAQIRSDLRSGMQEFEERSSYAWAEIQGARGLVPKNRFGRQVNDNCSRL